MLIYHTGDLLNPHVSSFFHGACLLYISFYFPAFFSGPRTIVKHMCVEIKGRTWGSIDSWSCGMSSCASDPVCLHLIHCKPLLVSKREKAPFPCSPCLLKMVICYSARLRVPYSICASSIRLFQVCVCERAPGPVHGDTPPSCQVRL